MGAIIELLDHPPDASQLAARYRAICEDPRFANLQGKVELDRWGKITLSPASNLHGLLQARLAQRLSGIGGAAINACVVSTDLGITVADLAWASDDFMAKHGLHTPFMAAPELCVEIASPSNSREELENKMSAYRAAGAREAWIVLPQSRRIEVYTAAGRTDRTTFAIDLDGLFA